MEAYNYGDLPEDAIREIMKEEDPETIISNCRVEKRLFGICKDPYFWLNYAKELNHSDFQKLLIILADYKIFRPLNEFLPREDEQRRTLPIVDFHTTRYLFMVVVENEAESLIPRLRPYANQDVYFNANAIENQVKGLKGYAKAINRLRNLEDVSEIQIPANRNLSVEYVGKYLMDNVSEDGIRALFLFEPSIEKYGLRGGITFALLNYWCVTGDWENVSFFIYEIYPRIPEAGRYFPGDFIKSTSSRSILKKMCKEKNLPRGFMCKENDFSFGESNIDVTLYQIETFNSGISFPGNKFLLDPEERKTHLSHPALGVYPETYISLVKQYVQKDEQSDLFEKMQGMFTMRGYTMAALLCEKEMKKI